MNAKAPEASSDLLMPTLGELLETPIPERQHILHPWLREHESCLLYAATGVGKSLFALTTALAVAGKLTTREREGQQVAYWDYQTGMELLSLLRWGLAKGLYINKSELAKAAGIDRSGANRIIDRGIKLRVWSKANFSEWFAKGRKRREAGETAKVTEAIPSATLRLDDMPEDL